MAKVLSFANLKGGVGKTSLTNAVAYEYADRGNNVLVIDLDPQASQTTLMRIDPSQVLDDEALYKSSSINIFKEGDMPEPLNVDKNLYLLPAVRTLQENVEHSLKHGNELKLMRYIKKIKKENRFDYILIDPPSNLGTLMIATILASDYIIIPQRLTLLDETGTVEFLSEMALQAELRDKTMNVVGIAPVFYRKNDRTYNEKMEKQKDEIKSFIEEIPELNLLNKDVFLPYIRDIVVWRRASEELMPLKRYIEEKEKSYQHILDEVSNFVDAIDESIGKMKVESKIY